MVSHYRPTCERRLQTARTQPGVNGQYVNGIDYLEVASDQKTLTLHLLHALSNDHSLTLDNVQITSAIGRKVPIAAVTAVGRSLLIRLQAEGDRTSTYTLRLVESPLILMRLGISETPAPPPSGFDPQLSSIQFSLPTTTSEFDPEATDPLLTDQPTPPPVIDYLAKDYASFRQLMLDRLSLTMPAAKERSPADMMVMLVEVLAYAADQLSYYQDAVATEAYLGTARRRMSVRRHARLLDYFMHDGCNARTWVALEVDPELDGQVLPGPEGNSPGTRFFTKLEDQLQSRSDSAHPANVSLNGAKPQAIAQPQLSPVIDPNNPDQIKKALDSDAQVFESLHDLPLQSAFNEIRFYTWGEDDYALPSGATRATLKDNGGKLGQLLQPERVLLFEENLNPETGQKTALELVHRHAVRLLSVTAKIDPLVSEGEGEGDDERKQPQRLVEVEWHPNDALPFQLWVSKRIDGRVYPNLAIARGNVVLVDHGYTPLHQSDVATIGLERAKLEANTDPQFLDENKLNRVPNLKRYRPQLENVRPSIHQGPLTHQRYLLNLEGEWVLFDPKKSAREAVAWLGQDIYPNLPAKEYNVNSTLSIKEYKAEELARESLDRKRRFIRPAIHLKEYNTQEFPWEYQPDLLNSDRFDRHFVVETEDNGQAYLRFGDDALGKRPEPGTYFEVVYRTGNGSLGNVGAEAIAHVVTELQGIRSVRNPLPAQGGIEPETLDQVRLYAPQAFRVPQRAVTEADYAKQAERFPGVQRAIARSRWTGSWTTIFLTVDRKDGRPLDESFKADLRTFLESFRLAGHDLEIESPQFVPVEIAMQVQVSPGYYRSSIKQALMQVFSNRILPDGQLGFFHPDQLTFGQPLYLSQVIDAAMRVEGVQSVEVTRFQRQGEPSQGELKASQITVGPLEIAQLNNDPLNPNQGRIEFEMKGGL